MSKFRRKVLASLGADGCRAWKSSMQCESFQSHFMSPSWFSVYVRWILNFCLLQVLRAWLCSACCSLSFFFGFHSGISRLQIMILRRLFISVITILCPLCLSDSPLQLLGVLFLFCFRAHWFVFVTWFTCTHMWHAKQFSARVHSPLQQMCFNVAAIYRILHPIQFNKIVELNSFSQPYSLDSIHPE